MPAAFAQELWTTTKLGARVIVTHEQVMPVEITHPALFVPRREPMVPPAVAQANANALKAAQQAWTFAELAGSKPLSVTTMTDFTPEFPMPESVLPAVRPLKSGQLSVFISRKEGRLFVRKGFEPVFDVPVAIARPTEPLGTHVFTALALKSDGTLRWNAVSTATSPSEPAVRPSVALDRITIPQDAIERISELVAPGSSLVISDQGLGPETGKGTDFIVLTR
jgi:hypothetical protein